MRMSRTSTPKLRRVLARVEAKISAGDGDTIDRMRRRALSAELRHRDRTRPMLTAALMLAAGFGATAIDNQAPASAGVSPPSIAHASPRAVIYGCEAEDACHIDYRARRGTDVPVWII